MKMMMASKKESMWFQMTLKYLCTNFCNW